MTAPPTTRVHRVACISAARMASWFDDIQRDRAQKDGGRSLEWVPGAIASVCQASARARLVAVCDLKPDLLEAFARRWPGPALYQDWREMVERERPDVVAIVTSYGSIHGDLAAAVAETGLVRAIYCEKPIASSMAQADRIAAACARHTSPTPARTSSAGTPATARPWPGSAKARSERSAPSPSAPWAPSSTPAPTR